MNPKILTKEVQDYINNNLDADIDKMILAKSPFDGVSSSELATQIVSKKKSRSKLPTWFITENIYYPPVLSIEQTSSEATASGKASIAKGETLIDLTAGFGVDSFYFAKKLIQVYSCEINEELSDISTHNNKILKVDNITCLATNGLEYLKASDKHFDNIYLDPARRSTSGKVFKLADCTPNVVEHLDLLFSKSPRIIIKTAPLLDIKAGLSELRNVAEIHIDSVKNECKELIWVLERDFQGDTKIICATYNDDAKIIEFNLANLKTEVTYLSQPIKTYLYEPDVAIMKSGAFDWIGNQFNLEKLASQTHLYTADFVDENFPGRIFKVNEVINVGELKKTKNLKGNVIVRNFPEKAEQLVKKYKIAPAKEHFIIFTKTNTGFVAILADIIQYY